MASQQPLPTRHRGFNPRFGGHWAKVEIFLGLAANGTGLFTGIGSLTRSSIEIEWEMLIGALALYVLGGYLTLAGHRSHLYRSDNEPAVHLTNEIQRLRDKG